MRKYRGCVGAHVLATFYMDRQIISNKSKWFTKIWWIIFDQYTSNDSKLYFDCFQDPVRKRQVLLSQGLHHRPMHLYPQQTLNTKRIRCIEILDVLWQTFIWRKVKTENTPFGPAGAMILSFRVVCRWTIRSERDIVSRPCWWNTRIIWLRIGIFEMLDRPNAIDSIDCWFTISLDNILKCVALFTKWNQLTPEWYNRVKSGIRKQRDICDKWAMWKFPIRISISIFFDFMLDLFMASKLTFWFGNVE